MKTNLIPALKVEISIDETKLTPEFFEEFRANFYDFYTKDEIIEHLGQLWARGMVSGDDKFIEGFGLPSDFGIRFNPSSSVDSTVVFYDE